MPRYSRFKVIRDDEDMNDLMMPVSSNTVSHTTLHPTCFRMVHLIIVTPLPHLAIPTVPVDPRTVKQVEWLKPLWLLFVVEDLGHMISYWSWESQGRDSYTENLNIS